MHKFALWVISILCISITSAVAEEPVAVDVPDKEHFHLFLLAGQSNMAGRGKVSKQDLIPHPRVLMLSQAGEWVPAVAPLHSDKPKVAGVGLGRTFAIEVAEANPGIVVGLIPCAVGGSPISSWEPGGYHASTKTHPYDDTLPRVKQALKSGTLKGILWHQGESDSQSPLAEQYETKLHELIARFRQDFDAPEVPFIAGQMGQFEERPWSHEKKQVDASHRRLSEVVPYCAFVSSDGLNHKGDEVHFDAESYRELGRRYAKAYFKLQQQPTH